MHNYVKRLELIFHQNAQPEIAIHQIKYMRNQFSGFGIPSPLRKELQRPFLEKESIPTKETAFDIIRLLWEKPEREFQYFALAMAQSHLKNLEKKDIELYEWMILQKSWWDTVDFIAPNLVGRYFVRFPEMRNVFLEKWMASENIWLQRSCLIFQLKYKNSTDKEILFNIINQLLGSKEFFINKAIGWSLRQYSKYNPEWVEKFVNTNPSLSGLSKREALKIIMKLAKK